MKRLTIWNLALAALPLALVVAAPVTAQAPGAAAAPSPSGRGVAVFNVAKVMKDYQKWQYFAEEIKKKTSEKTAAMARKQKEGIDLQEKVKTEVVQTEREKINQQLLMIQRQLEDMQKLARKELDEESMAHLRMLFGELRTVVDAVAKTNGFDLVLAYPDATTPDEEKSPNYLDLKLRTPAAMPFYVSKSIDITDVVVATLNKNFPAPGPVTQTPPMPGVTPAGATAPRP